MPITVIWRQQELQVPGPSTVGEVLHLLGLPPEQYLVVFQGELVSFEQALGEGDTIRLVGVISGGER